MSRVVRVTPNPSPVPINDDRSVVDGVTLAVMSNRLQGVVRKMMNTLRRTSRSGVANTARDLSCCIITAQNDLLVAADSLPIHVMSGPELMGASIDEFHPIQRRGDAYLHNSPYHGCSHAADLSIVVPVFDESGVKRFSVIAKAHQADIGNSMPTTYMATARDVYEEGALIFPGTKVQEDYSDIEDIIRICRMRIRVPDQWWGDYLALLGAARIGERELMQLGTEFGWEKLEGYQEAWFDYSERQMAAAIRQLPKGRTRVETRHDPFPSLPDGIPLSVTLECDPDEAWIGVDLRDNPDCLPCGLNLSEATARTEAMVGIFNSIGEDVPPNAGSFRRIHLQLRENCVMGIPRHPFSCSVATSNVAHRLVNAVQRAIAELGGDRGLADAAYIMTPSQGVISGVDPRSGGGPFVNQLYLQVSGFGASSRADGWLHGSAGSGGVTQRDTVEIDEILHPIRVIARRYLPDREGAGEYRGAPGGIIEYGPVDCDIEVMYASDGSVYPARGARGGHDGPPAEQYRRHREGHLLRLESCSRETIHAGETIVSVCGGGGGYGDPLRREEESVAADVAEGWISKTRARETYGVVIDEDGRLDMAATRRLRVEVRSAATAPAEDTGPGSDQ
jgi:N-methylhydantoinase B